MKRMRLCGMVLAVAACMTAGVVMAADAPATQAAMPADLEKALAMPEGKERTAAVVAAAEAWGKTDTVAAMSWLSKLKGPIVWNIAPKLVMVNPKASADWMVETKNTGFFHLQMFLWGTVEPEAALTWTDAKAPKNLRYLAYFSIGDGWVKKDRAAVEAWAVKLPAGDDRTAAIHGTALRLGRDDIAAATEWIKTLKPEEMAFAARVVASDWKATKLNKKDAKKEEVVKAWLDELPLGDAEKKEALESPAPDSRGPALKK